MPGMAIRKWCVRFMGAGGAGMPRFYGQAGKSNGPAGGKPAGPGAYL
ncbi:histone deacetylase Hda1 [Alicycliphilus sp. B1]|nr:histone deacetylase Hda1 [Alicycliphilus sp. B1]